VVRFAMGGTLVAEVLLECITNGVDLVSVYYIWTHIMLTLMV